MAGRTLVRIRVGGGGGGEAYEEGSSLKVAALTILGQRCALLSNTWFGRTWAGENEGEVGERGGS
jgi:hypothetical protein